MKKNPTKGGRYYKVEGKLVPEAEYKAKQKTSTKKGDSKRSLITK